MRTAATAMLVSSLALTACSGTHSARSVEKATPAQQAALLDRVKQLDGTWESVDDRGQGKSVHVFSVTSSGTAVREVMFPGTPHEMVNMYIMDGPTLMMTHYCAMGNQPHMRAAAGSGDRIEFKPDSVSNLTEPDGMYMGQMTLVFMDKDRIREEWASIKNGKPDGGHNPGFELVRKK